MNIEKALENNKDFNPDNFIDLRKSQETILNANFTNSLRI